MQTGVDNDPHFCVGWIHERDNQYELTRVPGEGPHVCKVQVNGDVTPLRGHHYTWVDWMCDTPTPCDTNDYQVDMGVDSIGVDNGSHFLLWYPYDDKQPKKTKKI